MHLELDRRGQGVPDQEGLQPDYGARPLRRAIENFVEDPLSEELLRATFQGMDTIVVDGIRDDEDKVIRLTFKGSQQEEPVAATAGETESEDESKK